MMWDLLRALYDIDVVKGRVCGSCSSWRAKLNGRRYCVRGMDPLDETDGCDKWKPRADTKAA